MTTKTSEVSAESPEDAAPVTAETHAGFAKRARASAETLLPAARPRREEAAYALEFPDGRVVRCDGHFDDATLERLLRVAGWFSVGADRSRRRANGVAAESAERVFLASAEIAKRRLLKVTRSLTAELQATAEAAESAEPSLLVAAEAVAAELTRGAESLGAEIWKGAEALGAEAASAEVEVEAGAEWPGASIEESSRFAAERRGPEVAGPERTPEPRTAEPSKL